MNPLLEKLRQVERELADEKGRFVLFALFRRRHALTDGWDLLAAAPWAAEWFSATRIIGDKLRAVLRAEELARVARIVVIKPDNPELEAVQSAVDVEHGLIEVQNRTFLGVDVERALFITCRRETVALPA